MTAQTSTAKRKTNSRSKLADDLAARAHEAIDEIADRASSAQHSSEAVAEEVSHRGVEAAQNAQAEVGILTNKVERYARDNPLTSAGIAFAAGIVVSSLLRR